MDLCRRKLCAALTATETHLLRETMARLEERLDPRGFLRVHRSSIVNLKYVKEVRRESNGDSVVVMDTGEKVGLGPKLRSSLISNSIAHRDPDFRKLHGAPACSCANKIGVGLEKRAFHHGFRVFQPTILLFGVERQRIQDSRCSNWPNLQTAAAWLCARPIESAPHPIDMHLGHSCRVGRIVWLAMCTVTQ